MFNINLNLLNEYDKELVLDCSKTHEISYEDALLFIADMKEINRSS